MVKTRRSPEEDDDSSVDGGVAEAVGSSKPPSSDMSLARKLVIAREGSLASSALHILRHPKLQRGVLFRLSEQSCDEVLIVEDEMRCLFIGNSIVADGRARLFTPFHPFFLALPYLMKKKSRFEAMDEILNDEEFPAISLLASNKYFEEILLLADAKDVCGERVYRYNEEKGREWLTGRFSILKTAMQKHIQMHESVRSSEDVLDRYCFGVFSDYLSTAVAEEMREHLHIKDAPKKDISILGKRRANESMDEPYVPSPTTQPAAKKPPAKTAAQKRLESASKGSKSLTSFFIKKT